MKKLSYFIVLFFVGLSILACREDHTEPGYSGSPLLHFQAVDGNVTATDVGYTDYVIDFGTIAGVTSASQVNLVQVDGDAVQGVDYEILDNNSVSLASGAMNGAFTVRVYGVDLDTDTPKTAVFGLKSSSVGNAVYNQTFTLGMLLKCPLPSNFPLTYQAQVFAFGEYAPTHTVTLVPVAGTENEFTMASSWGPNFVAWATGSASYAGQYPYPGTISINCSKINFVTTAGYGSNTTGTYDPVTGVISFDLQQSLFTSQFTTTVTLIPM